MLSRGKQLLWKKWDNYHAENERGFSNRSALYRRRITLWKSIEKIFCNLLLNIINQDEYIIYTFNTSQI
jgi:hypothetical protein